MDNDFLSDPFPGQLKILFIGRAESSHTQGWIDLLTQAAINVRLFAMPTGVPPSDWDVRTYVTYPRLKENLNTANRRYITPYTKPHFRFWLRRYYQRGFTIHPNRASLRELLLAGAMLWGFLPLRLFNSIRQRGDAASPAGSENKPVEDFSLAANAAALWLAEITRRWQPDVIHTLGLDHDQGGFFYAQVRQEFHLQAYGKWVLQLRGGSDLTLNRLDPAKRQMILQALDACDGIISDNLVNPRYMQEMGISPGKVSSLTPVPGGGGIDVTALRNKWSALPSQRERMILIPKAYESWWSKSLPLLEALRLAWDQIAPCKVVFLAADEETTAWARTLPATICQYIRIEDRLPHPEVLDLMAQTRVLLAVSLVDGVPNSLYEAMACGAFPIVSPLPTLDGIVSDPQHVLHARNLYPAEIAGALVRAMTDDALVDDAAGRNAHLVQKLADRAQIKDRVLDFYSKVKPC